MDKETNVLDTILTTFEEFEKVLGKCVNKMAFEDQKTMKEILGKNIRRVGENLPGFEVRTATSIPEGKISYIKLGASKQSGVGATEQYYIRTGTYDDLDW